jgi:transposase-like protein
VLLARSLLSTSEDDLAGLLREVQQSLPVPIHGVISDGQHSIRNAVRSTFPDVPHQLCHFHYLREADRHANDENPLVFCYSDQIDSWIAKNISAIS